MKKQMTLSIVLLLSLAGCQKQKKKPKEIAQNMNLFSSTNIPLTHHDDSEEEQDAEVLSFFDDDLGEFVYPEDDTEVAYGEYQENDVVEDEFSTVSWIDATQDEADIKTVYFGFNKYGVTEDQKDIITQDIALLEDLLEVIDEDSAIVIEGHSCHSAGAPAYNLGLSEKRAKYIADLLVEAGIEQNRIKIVGRGQEMPAVVDGKAVTGDRDAQWLNRRVEIKIVEAA